MRDGMGYIDRWEAQINAALPHFEAGSAVVCEGNSSDGTKERLQASALHCDLKVVTLDTGVKKYASVSHPERWANLTNSWNAAMAAIPTSCELVIAVESELVWDVDVLLECVAALDHYDVIAPMLFMQRNPARFYDTNGFRIEGVKFRNSPPYLPPGSGNGRYVRCDTVGGMIVTRRALARRAVWRDTCRLFFPDGTAIVADTARKIYHP